VNISKKGKNNGEALSRQPALLCAALEFRQQQPRDTPITTTTTTTTDFHSEPDERRVLWRGERERWEDNSGREDGEEKHGWTG
jgi:hypothetical protein